MHTAVKLSIVAIAAVFLASAGALLALRPAGPPSALAPDQRITDAGLAIPPFTLTDATGAPTTNAVFTGRLTVVGFIFTHCPFICPMITARMDDLALKHTDPRVRFMGISVDPVHDTPARLAEYAKEKHLDPARFTLLTGDRQVVSAIVTKGMKFLLEPDPSRPISLPDGSTMDNIVHPSWLALVGPDGKVLGLFACSVPEDMTALSARLTSALKELDASPRK